MAGRPNRPFQRDDRKYADVVDVFRQPKSMVRHDILEGQRKERLKRWITFFRRNPHRFITDYFGIHLHAYQILWIWIMQRSNLAYIVASRGAAKTFIIAIWAMTLCVLYPGIMVITASKTIRQGGLIIEKLTGLRDNYPNVAREIKNITNNQNGYFCIFHNGSTITSVPSSENSRGNRCNYLIIEESRLVTKDILEQILKPFMFSRTPPYRLLSAYKDDPDLREEGIITYITSAWYKSEYWYTYVKSCIKRMASGDITANFLAFDYLITIYHNIKTELMIKNEMSDNDALTVQMEYLNIPSGASGKSFYRQSYFPRTIKRAFYPQKEDNFNPKRNPYDIKKTEGELRFLSVDVATRAGKANDLTIIAAVQIIPMLGKGYERRLLYMESFKGINTVTQAKRIKQLFADFESDFLVIDLQAAGIGVFDSLSQVTLSEERNITYPAMTVVNREYPYIEEKIRSELQERTIGLGAEPVIFPILASAQSNSQMASLFRSSLQKKLWSFLISETEAEDWLLKNNKEYIADSTDSDAYGFFLNPYIQNSLLIAEAINLDMTLVGGLVKLVEKAGCYKDRYSSILYLNYIVSQFDKSLLKENDTSDDWDSLSAITMIY